eukprot:1202028-Pyramimonas_sp.AAC.1
MSRTWRLDWFPVDVHQMATATYADTWVLPLCWGDGKERGRRIAAGGLLKPSPIPLAPGSGRDVARGWSKVAPRGPETTSNMEPYNPRPLKTVDMQHTPSGSKTAP